CRIKVIKREFSNAMTQQQNEVAERKNMTLIENRVLVTKPHNKTHYELLIGRPPIISFMRPFGCPITILNTLDHPVKVVATARRLEMPLPKVCTAMEEKKKKLPVKDRWQLH
nr:hypothetical protein [Tanacetum cinerariifolium]